jgi:hypothetical protein
LTTEKKCSKCREVKPLELFRNERNQCKACYKALKKTYYEANADRFKEKQKDYYKNNTEKCSTRGKAWREANPDKVKELKKEWAEANTEKCRERGKAWRDANREKDKANRKAYRKKHHQKRLASMAMRRVSLVDGYVIKLLGIKRELATPELIEQKRTQLLFKRSARLIRTKLREYNERIKNAY